jgi:short-subunit dehydrogenase
MCGSATLQQYGCPQAHLRTGPTCGAPARQVNVVGAFIVLKAMGRHMRDNGGGAVVNTASMAAARGTPAMCAYVASKSALVGSVQPPPPETV